MSLRTIIAVVVGLLLLFYFVIFSCLMTSCHNQLLFRPLTVSASLPCDEECVRFGRLLDVWPSDKPKAAVVLLVKSPDGNVTQSLQQFDANFNDAYNYPVIVFHEENMNNEADRQRLRSFSSSNLYFQVYRPISPVKLLCPRPQGKGSMFCFCPSVRRIHIPNNSRSQRPSVRNEASPPLMRLAYQFQGQKAKGQGH